MPLRFPPFATIRNAALLGVMSLAASIEAPRISQTSLHVATESLVATPTEIVQTVDQLASSVKASHLGFDTNIYPGDRAMNAWKESGEYEWVGYYLPAPCHKDNSWSGTRERLVNNGWGLAVIYVGQQTWGKRLTSSSATSESGHSSARKSHGRRTHKTRTMTRRSSAPVAKAGDRCSAAFVNAEQGRIDARDAIATAAREGFARGTVVFLDIEYMTHVPQPMRDYYRAWTETVLADGSYRPGVYAHTRNASTIYDDISDVYDRFGVDQEPPFWICGQGGFSAGRPPTDVGHKFASAWQGLLDVVRTHNGIKLPIDISVASVASPSLVQ